MQDRTKPINSLVTPSRRSRVTPFYAMEVLSAAAVEERAGRHIVHMEIGEPGAQTPLSIRQAAAHALESERMSYTPALGRPTLREKIARHYRDVYGIDVPASRIAVTTGSSLGFLLAFLVLFDPGARVAVASPGYPAYRTILESQGIEVVPIETSAASRFVVNAAMIEAEHERRPLDGVLLMSPANPTGTMMTPQTLAEVARTCDRLGIRFISDEIYHGLTYDTPARTALEWSDKAVVVNSFSKYFCMTGWRIGWLVLPEELVRPVELLAQSLAISVPTLSQIAAEAAFDAREELEVLKAGYARNRAMLLQELPGMGLGNFHPVDGAFYVYCDVGHLTNDSMEFCKRLLVEGGVAATPGVDFDREQGHRAMRICFAGSETDVREGLRRLGGWLSGAKR